MPEVTVEGVTIDDTFAEAFGMSATGVVVTADTPEWALTAARTMSGFGTSVIGCGAEVGIDRVLGPAETPDGRPGARVLLFGFSADLLQPQLQNRVGQCVLTSPGSACFAGLDAPARLKLGARLRFFGDGYQTSKRLGARRYWRIPVMDGEFVCEDDTGVTFDAVGGGNLFLLGASQAGVLKVAEAAVAAIAATPDVITPFPGGIVRSGSKVGSKYPNMMASTNQAYSPTLRAAVASALKPDETAVLEIVIDGLSSQAVADAMKSGLAEALRIGRAHGLSRVSAGNYGGKLGKFHYRLLDLLP